MKKIILGICMMCASVGGWAQKDGGKPDPDFYVFLCLGQSNMEGNARAEIRDMNGVDERFRMMAAVDDAGRKREKGHWYTAALPCQYGTYSGGLLRAYIGGHFAGKCPCRSHQRGHWRLPYRDVYERQHIRLCGPSCAGLDERAVEGIRQ